MTTVAFIGLGNMGAPMAANLIAAGHTVRGFDLSTAAAEAAGVPVAGSAGEAVDGAEVVVTMLTSGAVVHAVYDEILPLVAPGTLMIDSSTISVDEARSAAQRAQEAGLRAVDAPVSGGISGAAAGTLAFMVGADDADLADVETILEPMAGKVVHCGGPGAGQAAKVCNNMVLAISMVGVSEAFVLGQKLGLTDQALFDVMSNASAQCWSLTTYCPVPGPVPTSPANNDYRPGFAAPLMKKDLGLAMKAAELTGTETRLGRHVADLYEAFADGAGRDLDFSGIIREIQEHSAGREEQA